MIGGLMSSTESQGNPRHAELLKRIEAHEAPRWLVETTSPIIAQQAEPVQ